MSGIEELARVLMANVRDPAMEAVDRLIGGNGASAQAVAWRDGLSAPDRAEAIRTLAPDIVDQVLFELLRTVDEGRLDLIVREPQQDDVVASAVGGGELAGWFMGSPGWRDAHSRTRFNDYLKDLRLERDWET